MRRQPNLMLIGGFVISAIVLAVIGIVILGSGKLFENGTRYVIYFDESVKGLTVGSAVTFQGVKIGEVKRVGMQFNAEDLKFHIPVIIEISQSHVKVVNTNQDKGLADFGGRVLMRKLIDRGLRAQIQIESFVTGRLYIGLGFFPEKPARLLSAKIPVVDTGMVEVPSVPSSHEEAIALLSDLPLKDATDNMMQALEGFNRLVNLPEIEQLFKSANTTLQQIDQLVANLNGRANGIADKLDAVLSDARRILSKTDGKLTQLTEKLSKAADATTLAMTGANQTLIQGEKAVTDIAAKYLEVADAARLAMVDLRNVIQEVEFIMADDSPIITSLAELLNELTRSARTFGAAADYIQRHPESILRGKPLLKGE